MIDPLDIMARAWCRSHQQIKASVGASRCACEGECRKKPFPHELAAMRAIADALDEAGFAIVPKEASEAQIEATGLRPGVVRDSYRLAVAAGAIKPQGRC